LKEDRIVKFVFEQHTRLSCIIRYNNTPKLSPESVAEHSYYVTFLSMLIGDYLTNKGVVIDREKLLKMALFHDVEEIISGDIIRILKKGEFGKALDKLNRRSMEYLCGILGGAKAEEYFALWEETREKKTLEAKVMSLADILSCLIYCVKEMHCGNKYFREILEYASKVIDEYKKEIPEISSLVKAFKDYARGYLSEYSRIIKGIEGAVRVDIKYPDEGEKE